LLVCRLQVFLELENRGNQVKKSITIIILPVIIIISAVPLGFGFWAELQMNGIMEKMKWIY